MQSRPRSGGLVSGSDITACGKTHVLCQGRALQAAEKTHVLCQGTTLVGPKTARLMRALAPEALLSRPPAVERAGGPSVFPQAVKSGSTQQRVFPQPLKFGAGTAWHGLATNQAVACHKIWCLGPPRFLVVRLIRGPVRAACGRFCGAAALPWRRRALALKPPSPAPRPTQEYRRCCLGLRRDG
jgi:hypothetical protein